MGLHNKLKPYGIAITGWTDGFSCYVVWMEAYRTNNHSKAIKPQLSPRCWTCCWEQSMVLSFIATHNSGEREGRANLDIWDFLPSYHKKNPQNLWAWVTTFTKMVHQLWFWQSSLLLLYLSFVHDIFFGQYFYIFILYLFTYLYFRYFLTPFRKTYKAIKIVN